MIFNQFHSQQISYANRSVYCPVSNLKAVLAQSINRVVIFLFTLDAFRPMEDYPHNTEAVVCRTVASILTSERVILDVTVRQNGCNCCLLDRQKLLKIIKIYFQYTNKVTTNVSLLGIYLWRLDVAIKKREKIINSDAL